MRYIQHLLLCIPPLDQNFPLPPDLVLDHGSKSGHSLNSNSDKDLMEECIYGNCFLRILYQIPPITHKKTCSLNPTLKIGLQLSISENEGELCIGSSMYNHSGTSCIHTCKITIQGKPRSRIILASIRLCRRHGK